MLRVFWETICELKVIILICFAAIGLVWLAQDSVVKRSELCKSKNGRLVVIRGDSVCIKREDIIDIDS